jgi:hypothetical protein
MIKDLLPMKMKIIVCWSSSYNLDQNHSTVQTPNSIPTTIDANILAANNTRALKRGKISSNEADLLLAPLAIPDNLVDDYIAGIGDTVRFSLSANL